YVTADGSTYYQFTDHDGSGDDLTSLYIEDGSGGYTLYNSSAVSAAKYYVNTGTDEEPVYVEVDFTRYYTTAGAYSNDSRIAVCVKDSAGNLYVFRSASSSYSNDNSKITNLYYLDSDGNYVSLYGCSMSEAKSAGLKYYLYISGSYVQTDGSFYRPNQLNTIGQAFTLAAPSGTSYVVVYKEGENGEAGVLTVTSGGKTIYSGDGAGSSPVSVDTESVSGAVIFTVELDEYGTYEIKRVEFGQSYIYYAEYFYTYNSAEEGVEVESGTLNAANSWSVSWDTLSYPVYETAGNDTVIGYNAYYIEETVVSGAAAAYTTTYSLTTYSETEAEEMAKYIDEYLESDNFVSSSYNGETSYSSGGVTIATKSEDSSGTAVYYDGSGNTLFTKTVDSSGSVTYTVNDSDTAAVKALFEAYLSTLTAAATSTTETDGEGNTTTTTTVTYSDKAGVLFYKDENGTYYTVKTANSSSPMDLLTGEGVKMTTYTITNKEREAGVTLPGSGGNGENRYILAGAAISLAAILLLYKRRKGLSDCP
ncbi:MAG: LPXTG cell wall anchor domain-containing protein, partial [Clostridiales bacterium]|nr:LPXTG cell wall anchor domain-containing protein [Clostridiales bacterium]